MPNKRITKEIILEKKEQLIEIAKQCNVEALYYFQPESDQNLSYMANAHFLAVPIVDKMSNNDLYELENNFKKILACKVFIKTEEHLQELLKDNTVTQAEYDLALKKVLSQKYF